MSKLQPIIKWSGSKRSQAEQIVSLIDKNYDSYYESFCGGCSVLFYILNHCPNKFKHYVIEDTYLETGKVEELKQKYKIDYNTVINNLKNN